MKEVIAYYRRSTKHGQKHSLESQRIEVETFCKENGLKIVATFEETESGKSVQRPVLQRAIQLSNKKQIPIVILRLDRLGRKASEIIDLAFRENIIIAEHGMHQYDKFSINVMASLAEKERELISRRTKQGLRAAKAKGIVLGNPKIHQIRKTAIRNRKRAANQFAKSLESLFSNFTHLNNSQLARNLNDWNIPTRKGGAWFPETVKRIRKRLEEL